MADSWLDHIPSQERERIRKKLRSPEAYEKLRENVKGPEDLEKEMKKNEQVAEAKFLLETEPALQDALKKDIERELQEEGMASVLDHLPDRIGTMQTIDQGKFLITVEAHPDTHIDQLTIVPEGNIQEKIPLKAQVSDRYIGQLITFS